MPHSFPLVSRMRRGPLIAQAWTLFVLCLHCCVLPIRWTERLCSSSTTTSINNNSNNNIIIIVFIIVYCLRFPSCRRDEEFNYENVCLLSGKLWLVKMTDYTLGVFNLLCKSFLMINTVCMRVCVSKQMVLAPF